MVAKLKCHKFINVKQLEHYEATDTILCFICVYLY